MLCSSHLCSICTNKYMEDYTVFVTVRGGTVKMAENAISKASRAKAFVKFMMVGWTEVRYWTWEFLANLQLIKLYPVLLKKFGLAPSTISLYVGHALCFVEYFFDTPPHHCRLAKGKLKQVQRELKKVLRMAGRTVLGRQVEVKQQKQQRLVIWEALATCQSLARAKIPELLDDIEKAPPRDPPTRYRFFGYLGAYIASIYGHRTGVLTCMRVKEVKEALGYLINVRDHKTLRKFGLAQIFLDGEEYGWCKRWLELKKRSIATNPYFFSSFGKGQAKDMVRYVRRAWGEMGLPGSPSLLDIRSAVATYNFESNKKEEREKVATQERFYVLHKTVALAGKMRQRFILSSLEEKELAAPPPSPPPVGVSKEERRRKQPHADNCPPYKEKGFQPSKNPRKKIENEGKGGPIKVVV
ncbi:uncharacterized protein LOC131967988 [Centropristis striata]|uniref:uncharacterized protein LOC131967988 n=1 Tax=Centropristis striata TaxID=184440 RepID=UPI0027E0B506|nr:uncharacterized protein LOC131967988 [Centropristis striata]